MKCNSPDCRNTAIYFYTYDLDESGVNDYHTKRCAMHMEECREAHDDEKINRVFLTEQEYTAFLVEQKLDPI